MKSKAWAQTRKGFKRISLWDVSCHAFICSDEWHLKWIVYGCSCHREGTYSHIALNFIYNTPSRAYNANNNAAMPILKKVSLKGKIKEEIKKTMLSHFMFNLFFPFFGELGSSCYFNAQLPFSKSTWMNTEGQRCFSGRCGFLQRGGPEMLILLIQCLFSSDEW